MFKIRNEKTIGRKVVFNPKTEQSITILNDISSYYSFNWSQKYNNFPISNTFLCYFHANNPSPPQIPVVIKR